MRGIAKIKQRLRRYLSRIMLPATTRGTRVGRRHRALLVKRMGKAARIVRREVVRAVRHIRLLYAKTHHHVAYRPHHYLLKRMEWYKGWHGWAYHKHVHGAALGLSVLVAGVFMLGAIRPALAADLIDNWNFSTPGDYTLDSGLENTGSSVRLKAQNYVTDANTSALYHLDEPSGTNVTDSSANGNNATVNGTATWVAGRLNNGFSFSNTVLRAADSASLSLPQANSLEAWTKFTSSIGAGTHDQPQGVIDKGAYKLYYDQETGKVTYELANNGATTWTQQAGNDVKGSWDVNGKLAVQAQINIGSEVYAGLGNAIGDAEVWKWDGTTWTQIGGDGRNSSWADSTYEAVYSLAVNGTTLYAGLGNTAGDAEVWSCDTATDCATWTKIGGDGINSGWAVNTFEEVDSMTVMGGNLYVGLGTTANDARVYRWNGSTWTWVGGFGIGVPYNAFPTGYEAVYALANDGTNLYASFGNTAGDGDVWRLTGTTWTQVGGDALNSSWAAATYEYAYTLRWFNGALYAGLGATAGDAEVWSFNGTTWTKIGGDTLNSGWDATFELVYSLADDGTNLYAGLGNTAGDNEVWRWNGSAWTKIGGDAINSGFTNTHTHVNSMVYAGGTLYAGLTGTGTNAEIWSWNGSAWTRMGGGYVNKSWGFMNMQSVESLVVSGEYLYAGTGIATAGNAQVWRFDGNTWQIVGGQGVNGSWAINTYEDVMSLTSYGGNLYAGLGTTASDAEVWRFNGTTWTQVGGDSLNGSWAAGYEEVTSMVTQGGFLYAGLGNSASDAEVYRWNGSGWTKIGGDALNSSWAAGFERVSALSAYNGQLYATLGNSTTDAEVWRWNGSAWTKIGGDGVNSSWNTTYEEVTALQSYNGKLYAGLSNTTGDAEVWEYNGTTWAQVGGDGLNSGWLDGQYEQARSLGVYNGKLYAGLALSTGDGEIWEMDGTTWSKVAGGVNGSWAANTIESVRALTAYKGKLYTAVGDTLNADAQIWSYGNNGFLQSGTAAQDTNWHHVAATYDGTTMRIYIDGVLDSSAAVSLSLPDTDQELLLGSTYGAPRATGDQGYFAGQLDEVRISNTARSTFTTKPYAATAQTARPLAAVRENGVWHWDTFAANETLNGGTITYRLSHDGGTTWRYWNGSGWTLSANTTQANTAAEVNTNIALLPVTFSGIVWQAILQGDGTQQVTLNSVAIESTSDTTDPAANASAITAQKANGGAALASNGWTNGNSPYFSWTAGTDTESGIKGYCAYVGTDNTADPVSTKGLLGTSPTTTGGHCQFITNTTNLDLGTPGLLGTPLSSSTSPYYLTLKAIDNAGNVINSTVQFQFRFDNTPPTNPGFITAPSGFVNTKAITMTWPTTGGSAAADAVSGVAGLQYRIGSGGTWYGDTHSGSGDINDLLANDGSYLTQDPPDFDDLIEGTNTVYFRTWDTAGNVTSSYVTAALKINTAGAPSEPQNVIATPSTNTTNAFAFDWDPPSVFVGDVNNLTYCYTVNTLPSAASCSFTSAGVTSLGAGPYATQPGANTFYVVARDESSNINYASYTAVTFTANTPAPGMPLNVDIVDVSIKATNNWRLALTWDPPTFTGAGIAQYKVYRSTDNITFAQVGTSSSTTYIDAGLTQQRYYYRIRACDSTSNCGADSSTVNELPTGKFTSPAALVSEPTISGVTTRRARIQWSTDRPSDSKISIGTTSGSYSASEIGNSTQVTAHEVDLNNLSAGTTYYFVARWTDEDGNTGISQEQSFTTSPAPALKEIETDSITLDSARVTFTSKNATKVILYYGPSEAFGGAVTINTSTAESNYQALLNNLADGTKYFYKLVAYDAEGATYDGSIFSFTTPARPKITDLKFQPVEGEPTSTQRVTWNTNVPSTSTVTYGKVGTVGVDIQDSKLVTEHQVIIRNLEDDSEYFLYAQSRDVAGNLATSDRQVFHTALDTRSPQISNVVVESSIRGTGAEARGQVVVSWRTDEPATSQIAYVEGSGATTFNNRTAEDTALAFEHIVIVSDLPTSKVYSLQPVSRDKAENVGNGPVQSAIIGRASDDVLTIVLETLKNIFGL